MPVQNLREGMNLIPDVIPYYEEDGITVIHGNAIELLPSLPRGVLVTDPPYGISYSSSKSGERWRATKDDASWAGKQIAGDHDTSLRDQVIEWADVGLVFGSWKVQKPIKTRQVLIWDKGPAFGMGDLSIPWKPSFEEIYVLGKGFTGSRDEGVIKGLTGVTWETKGRVHPNEKPVSLMTYLLSKCPPGVIIDPFCGSGSTLRAAKNLGREAIGIDIDEYWCSVAVKRLSQLALSL